MHRNLCMLVSLALHRPFIVPVYTTQADSQPPSAPRGNLSGFIGEDPIPVPLTSDQSSRRAPNPRLSHLDPTSGLGSSPPDPSAWSNEQQQQFLQALLGGSLPGESLPLDVNAPITNNAAQDDPLLALLSGLGIEGSVGPRGKGLPQPRTEPKQKTSIQKLLPLLHIISVWVLVAFFIFWREPEAFRERNSVVVSSGNMWSRWARLASGTAEQSTWGIEIVVSLRWSRL
jgi:GET complex subunit GET2